MPSTRRRPPARHILVDEPLLGLEDDDRRTQGVEVESPPAVRPRVLAAGALFAALVLPSLFLARPADPWAAAACLALGVGGALWATDRFAERDRRRRGEALRQRLRELDVPLPEGTEVEDALVALLEDVETRSRAERDSFISTIVSLASALEARDPYTRNHSRHVANLSVRMGRHLGLDRSELYAVYLGGMLHDIGKIGIADDILLKPAGLTKAEYEIMKTHPDVGARILRGVPGMEEVAEIVLCHHEMPDGRGYPRGLAGEEIPRGARVVAVADTWLSMVEDRPYRKGRRLEKARAEMIRVAGAQLDADAVDALFAALGEAAGRSEDGMPAARAA